MSDRPNVILVMTDQQRGDCLGVEQTHPVLTPNLDALAASGARFTSAYSTCPVCIPARRSLLSGQSPATHGMVGYVEGVEWDAPPTLPGVLRDAGYQTYLVGRDMHQHPRRRRFGYEEMVTGGDDVNTASGDYQKWLARALPTDVEHAPTMFGGPTYSTGVMHNDWTARPWPFAEELHFTNWTAAQARRFLARRDPSCPFFLTVSFLAPHPPLIPPQFYFDRYLRMDLPAPAIGDWARPPEGAVAANSPRVELTGEILRSCQAGYYGLINHVDDQIRRFLYNLHGIAGFDLADTIVVFTADHGEMLGDHYRWRKSLPYEGAARIPMLVSGPDRVGVQAGAVIDAPVSLEDVMPTVLDLVGLEIPATVDGRSMAPLLRGERPEWRPHVHIEHNGGGFHALTDGKRKYVWFTADGREQFFDLVDDRRERCDLSGDPAVAGEIARWRQALIAELRGRPEGFVRGGELQAGCDYPPLLSMVKGSERAGR